MMSFDDVVAALRANVTGSVLMPADEGYDAARMAWNLLVDQHPAVIVIPESAHDIVTTVGFARDHGQHVSIQATGHGVAEKADGRVLINTSALTDVSVDADSGTAWVGAGATWQPVLEAAQAVGLAPLLGSSPGVGAVGYTLGGGVGWLARRYGLAADSVTRFEVVTADGNLLHVSPDEHPDLFWGLKGAGGGGLAIVTGMEIRLFPVTRVYGGNLLYPPEDARAVMQRYREWIDSAPDELTSAVALLNVPPIEQAPEFLRGRSFAAVRGCYTGTAEDGEKLLAFWRDWKEPAFDMFEQIPFAAVASISQDPPEPVPGLATGEWLRALDDETIDVLIRYGLPHDGPCPLVQCEVRHLGGAIARVDPDTAAYSNRDSALVFETAAMVPAPEMRQPIEQHIAALQRDLAPHTTGGAYLNFLEGDEKRARTAQGFAPATYERLRSLKAEYDPEGVLAFGLDL